MYVEAKRLHFLGDTHFGHANILKYCHRPFAHIDEMNDVIIENVNKHVPESDILVHVGDFSFDDAGRRSRTQNAEHYLRRIRCKNIVKIMGNHDPHNSDGHVTREFASLFMRHEDIIEIQTDWNSERKSIIVFHYACRVWNKSHHGALLAYGHSHYSLPDDPNALSLDVGVDAVAGRATGRTHEQLTKHNAWHLLQPENYRPMSFDEFMNIMSTKKFQPIDHHGGPDVRSR